MKSIFVSIVAAVVLVGCGPSVGIRDAMTSGNIEAVKEHIAAGTDLNEGTPLHLAAFGLANLDQPGPESKKIVELLIAGGADVNAQAGKLDETPLDRAIMEGQSGIANLLRKHGG